MFLELQEEIKLSQKMEQEAKLKEERLNQKRQSEMLLDLKEREQINDSKAQTVKMRRTKEERRNAQKEATNDK